MCGRLTASQNSALSFSETEAKYGRLCFCVADRILNSREDSEECVNDTWLHAWNAIPPEKPRLFSAWLSRVTRNLAVSRLREARAAKRGGSEMDLVLDELAEWDAVLVTYYQGRYPLRTVGQLGATVSDDDLVTTHYGDWPAPEIFVINK